MRRARLGDIKSFELLLHRHFGGAFAVAFAHTEDRADAEDVCQEAFLKAYEKLSTCLHPDRFGAWLTTIVRNQALNSLRGAPKRCNIALSDNTPIAPADQPDERFMAAERHTRVWAALGRLPGVEREVTLLHLVDDLSHAVIARTLGISEFMSRHHLSRARRKLRAWLASDQQPRESA